MFNPLFPFPARRHTLLLMRILLLFLFLIGCGRGLTEAERVLAGGLMGDALDTAPIRLIEAPIGNTTRTYPARPQTTCREKIAPPPTGPTIQTRTAGAVAWTHVLTSPDWTIPDYATGYPDRIYLVAAMFFAHEMVHVWQWQNRDVTGYSPFKGLAEHRPGVDPYLFDPAANVRFLDMGYEQQAALVEEFICCRTLAPEGARTARLHATLAQVLPVRPIHETPKPSEVLGVYENADLRGVCD